MFDIQATFTIHCNGLSPCQNTVMMVKPQNATIL